MRGRSGVTRPAGAARSALFVVIRSFYWGIALYPTRPGSMSLQDRLGKQNTLQLICFSAGLSLMTLGNPTVCYNFPLMVRYPREQSCNLCRHSLALDSCSASWRTRQRNFIPLSPWLLWVVLV